LNIDLRSTPNFKNTIAFAVIEPRSRKITTSYLPFIHGDIGLSNVQTNIQQKQKDYYALFSTGLMPNQYPFSQTRSRLFSVERGGVGAEWQLQNPSVTNSGHVSRIETSFIREHNTEFVRWKLTANGVAPDNDTTHYDDDRIIRTVSKEPGWISGKTGTTVSYSDQYGRLRLTRSYLDETNYAQTAYIYDVYNRLRFVVPPGTPYQVLNEGEELFDKYFYAYRYNMVGQLVAKKTPQKGWMYIVYDKLDRPVLTQDALQREKGIWIFVKYDKLGRAVISGTYAGTQTQQQLENSVNATTFFFEERNGLSPTGYTNRTFPSTLLTEYEVFYYDDYTDIPAANPWRTTGEAYCRYTPRQIVAMKTRILGSVNFLWSTFFYDSDSRLIVQYNQNDLGGYDKRVVRYDRAGLQTSVEVKYKTSTDSVIIHWRNEYDHRGRLLKEYMRTGNQAEVLRSTLDYNELGQVISHKQHSTNGGNSFLQTQQFTYDKIGQLKKVNNVNNTSIAQLFAYEIQREDDVVPNYNGNIGSVSTKIHAAVPLGRRVPDRLSYRYDGMDRLRSVKTASGGLVTGDYDEYFSYDIRGNLTSLGRYAEISGLRTRIDSLRYSYDHDRHTRVDNVAGVSGVGFTELTQSANEYRYNSAGFMLADDNKGISRISYNVLGLIDTVRWSNGNRLIYSYSGSGVRLSKSFISGSNSMAVYYGNGLQYSSVNGAAKTLDFVQIVGGRLRKVGGDFRSEYDLTDHLGNTRVTFDEDPLHAGQARLLQHNSYYAFGGLMPGPAMGFVSGKKNKYLYNNKELQEETGFYDYGFRMYDPSIGRWHSIDPLAENHYDLSAYQYVMNNPLRYVDPMGLDTVDITGGKPGDVYVGDWIKNGSSYQLVTQEMFDDIRSGNMSSVFFLFPEVPVNGIRRSLQTGSTAGGAAEARYWAAKNEWNSFFEGQSYYSWLKTETMRKQAEALNQARIVAFEKAELAAAEKAQQLLAQQTAELNWYGPAGKVNWGVVTTAALLENTQGSFRLTNGVKNGSKLSLWYYSSGWSGGSRARITTYNISRIGKGLGRFGAGAGLIMDGMGVLGYLHNPNSPNAVHPGKAVFNAGMSGLGFTEVGTIPSIIYFGIDAFYPGGANGYMSDYSDFIYRNPNYYPRFSF
jgi:RHS repeat-associated protein